MTKLLKTAFAAIALIALVSPPLQAADFEDPECEGPLCWPTMVISPITAPGIAVAQTYSIAGDSQPGCLPCTPCGAEIAVTVTTLAVVEACTGPDVGGSPGPFSRCTRLMIGVHKLGLNNDCGRDETDNDRAMLTFYKGGQPVGAYSVKCVCFD